MLTDLILFKACLVQAMTAVLSSCPENTILPHGKVFSERKMFLTLSLNYCHINIAEDFDVLKIGEDTLILTGSGTCY